MFENLLKDIGFTNSEVAVYFALLEIGSSTTGPIIKNAGIASGKVYLILDKLINKGLVTYVIKAGTKNYQARNPERILDYLKEKQQQLKSKENQLNKIMPAWKSKYEEKKYKPSAEVFEGVKGFKTFYEWVLKELKKGDEICIMGIPLEANKRFEAYLVDWSLRRIKKGVKARLVYNNDCRKFGLKREKMELTKVRYMKPELETPAWIDIFQDYVATINVHGIPQCFLIRNKETAESYSKYFEIIWKQSTA